MRRLIRSSRLLARQATVGMSGGLIVMAAVVACASPHTYSTVSPGFANHHPRSIAILPLASAFGVASGMESFSDAAGAELANRVQKDGRFDRVIGPAQVQAAMAQNRELADLVRSLTAPPPFPPGEDGAFPKSDVKAPMTEKEIVGKVCTLLNVDSVVRGRIELYGTEKPYGPDFEVTMGYQTAVFGIDLRWDDKSGDTLWQASDVERIPGNRAIVKRMERARDDTYSRIMSAWPG